MARAATKKKVSAKKPTPTKRKPKPAARQAAGLKVGDKAPAFKMPSTSAHEISPGKLKGSAFVLYFYPKDDTSGCTAEACGFRDALPQFKKLGVPVIGVSKDSLSSHEKFKKKYDLNFPLASDEEGKVCAAYGVWIEKSMYGRKYMGIERSTFLIDGKGVIRAVWRKVSVPGHVEEVKKGDKKSVTKPPVIFPATAEAISEAATLLRAGSLVAFPTETVYGLGGDAANDQAIASIYAAKGRPQFNPLIVHVATAHNLNDVIIWNDTAQMLADQFWPGPLTLVLPRAPNCPVSLLASAGLDSLAVRVPSHPVAQELLRTFGKPVAAPSANASGKLSPTTPTHVMESLGTKVAMILAGGKSEIGLESTVLDLTAPQPTILRSGGVTREQLEMVLHKVRAATHDENAPRSPGMLASHYAPNLPLRLEAHDIASDEALLAFGPDNFIKGGAMRLNLSVTGDLIEAAANLFAMLRQLDHPKFSGIAVMPIPMNGLGAAINDRLQRAAAPRT